jgi:hypothetical protein
MRQAQLSVFATLLALFISTVPSALAAESNLLANGGFEAAGHMAAYRVDRMVKEGMRFDSADPLLPLRWIWSPGGSPQLRVVSDAHTGRRAAQVTTPAGAGLHLVMSMIEVVPGATYSFGAWTKGAGKGVVLLYGQAFEGPKELARKDFSATSAWAETRAQAAIPGNIRTVHIDILVFGDSDLILDDAFVSADFPQPHDPDAVLNVKPRADENTLAYMDFDSSAEFRLEGGAAMTPDGGGRFGKGLRLERSSHSQAFVPLKLDKMPDEGTWEIWLSPDEIPPEIGVFAELMAGDLDVMKLQSDTSESLRLCWRTSEGLYDPQNSLTCSTHQSRDWFRKGHWQHVAVQWDKQAVRLYVNGVLADLSTDRPLPFFRTPSAILLGSFFSVYAWSGLMDEVRLSSVQRYGPFVPVGAKWTPLPVAAAPAKPEPAEAPARKAPDFAAERKALVGAIPPPPPDAPTFDASAMKPLVADDAGFKMERDVPLAGMTTALVGQEWRRLRDPDNYGGFWKLEGLKPGRYFAGVWYESGKPGAEARQERWGAVVVHLNGRILQLSTTSDPVQVAPGVYYAEAQAAEAALMKPGDEIDVLPELPRRTRVLRLTLYPSEPTRGHNWVPENYGGTWFSLDCALRLNLDADFGANAPGFRHDEYANLPADLPKAPDGTHALATCRIANPLAVPLTVEFTAQVRAYFRELVGEDKAILSLKPHERITRQIPYTIIPDSRRYTIEAHARALKPPALGWPATDTISFFPGVRQSLPWPDPFTARDERALQITGPLPGERARFALDGVWKSAFTTSLSPPATPDPALTWTDRRVPFSYWECMTSSMTPRPHAIYLRRTFTMPDKEEKKTYRLGLTRALDEATVYVNGQKVGNVRGGDTPLVCDISGAVRAGDNEVLLLVRDLFAIMDPDYVNPAAPVFSVAYLDAPGGASVSGFGLGNVWIESSPSVSAADLICLPSVRRKQMTARFSVTSHEQAPLRVRVAARVLDAGKPVLDLGSQEIPLEPRQSVPLALTKPWADPILWGPASPKLLTVAVETVDAATGRHLDLLRERFGFRESWVDKGRLYFNGAQVRFKGSTCQGGGGVNIGDIQWSRGTEFPDFMDEFGYPVSWPLASIFNSSSRHNVDRDLFWETAQRNVLAGAALYGNHPCILAWDLSNEWLCFLDYGGGDPMKAARRFKTLDDALKRLDSSRWTFFNGDEDLHGLHDTFSTHYMVEAANGSPITGYNFHGHSAYYPDGAFFRPLDQAFKLGEDIVVNMYRHINYRYGEQCLMDTENLWKVSAYMPPGPCRFAGEDDVLGPGIDSGRGPIAWMWKQNLDGQRDLGVWALCNYTPVCGVARRGHAIQGFIMPDHTHHCFAGATLARDYSLHNNLFAPSTFVFRWALVDPAGKPVAQGEDARKMGSGDIQRGKLSFVAPAVRARTKFALHLKVIADGKFVYGEERDLEVWPQQPPPPPKLARKVFLFDPAGATASALKKAGVAFTSIRDLAAPEGAPESSVLIVGEGAVVANPAPGIETLGRYVASGGRLLVLAQSHLLPGLPVRTGIETKEWVSMPFVRTPQHPALAGVTSWDLHFWSTDHVSARGAYSKPDAGSFVALVDSGTDTGLEWVQMMECYRGRGLYLLTQLPLAGKYDAEPMARELLARLVAYVAGGKPFRAPQSKLQVVARALSPAFSRLRDLGVSCEAVRADAPLAESSVLMIDAADLKLPFDPPASLKAGLAAGATVIVHGVGPEHAAMLSALAGRAVSLTVQPFGMWEGRAYRNGFAWLTPGLSHIDLYWKRYEGAEYAVSQAEDPSFKIEDTVWYSASADGATEHIFPGGLVEIPVGRGRLLIDQMRWDAPAKQIDRLQSRLVSAMMTGLGVAIEPYAAPRPLPSTITYKPLDLAAFANRGFADQVGDDGIGGWSDQGPDIDLHQFPTGPQSFGGVPFLVGAEPHCCVVLKSDARPFPEKMPDDVTIPLGHPVEGLWFLHGATYSGDGPIGFYEVQYADGTAQQIPLVAGENLRDWVSTPALLPREKGTQSRVAWTGTTKVFPVVAVYQMLWVNPNPSVPVKAVRFANPTRIGCPILIALTAAVKDEKAAAEQAAAQARARDLLARGLAAMNAGKDAEARDLLGQAAKADPSLEAAYQALAQVCEKLKDEDAALSAYRAWIQAGAHSPLPFNRVGEILEKRKDYKGALEAYARSLQVEWNQPPIIEAKARMEKMVKP